MGAASGWGDLGFLSSLAPVSAAEIPGASNIVPLHPDIEPIVRLLEETPREKLLEAVAGRIHEGLNYRDLVAALQLAGVRNIQPRPHVGFKFHAVLVVNSAHIASVASPEEHRWLPIFWALDHFKDSQADDVSQGDWTMQRVDEAHVPVGDKAAGALIAAMDNWDVAAADTAAAGLARSAGVNEIFELMFRYGARDFRDIGHKAIYVSNSLRTLELIGQQHTEPVLRSLAYALLAHDGDNPSQRSDSADLPWRENVERAKTLRPDWTAGNVDRAATLEILAMLRQADEHEACAQVVEIINRGVHPQAVWDAMFLGAGELLVRQPGIVALHAVTTTNALRYAWNTSGSDDTRRMLLLQNAAFLPMFRQAMVGRGGKLKEFDLTAMQPISLGSGDRPAVEEILADVSSNKMDAAGKTLSYLAEHPDPTELVDAARLLIFLKGTNAHDYKFSSAVLEDHTNVSPEWRARFLASSVFNLRGSSGRDNALVERTRAALS
ncbi:MAG: hypothetical protein WD845_01520 [Pirellulales bacterium]